MEAVANCNQNPDLELIGVSALIDHSPILKQAVESNTLTENNSFKNIFGLNTNFYYVIESISNNAVSFFERGVGYAYEQDNKIFLKRHSPFVHGKNQLECVPCRDGVPHPFMCCGNGCRTMIYSSIPQSYLECFVVDHAILTSSEQFLPNPVQLKNDSLLGRFDGDIESVPFDDNRLVDKISNLVSKFTKQLKLKASKLSLKRVEPEIIDLVPTSNPKAKKGSLYYDEQEDSIKVFDGENWKTLAFVKE